MMSEKLKPCPFCGGEAEISHGHFDGKDTSYVLCKRCAATGEFFIISFKHSSDDRAVEAWNKRVNADVGKKIVHCKNCKYAHMTISGSCKYCDQFTDDYGQLVEMYFDKDFFCGYAERKAE